MDNFQIETAQNVTINQNIANLGDRILAYIIDSLILAAYQIIMLLIFGSSGLFSYNLWVAGLIFGLPLLLYHLLFETFNDGQSPGKAALKIRVVKLDGAPPSFPNYLIRWLFRIIDFGLTSGACAIVTYLITGKGQRLGDIGAKTTVISEKETMGLKKTLTIDLPDGYTPTYPQVTVFSDRDMQEIKTIYHQAYRRGNWEVLNSLAKKLTEVMDISTPDDTIISFIQCVIRDYNFYTQQ